MMGLVGLALVAAPVGAIAQPLDLFYERTVMTAADARCDLFAPEISAALAASAYQAKGASLRAGAAPKALLAIERNAQTRSAQFACSSTEIVTAAGRVRDAFAGYAKITRLSYPGDVAGWRADRQVTRGARWRLAQETRTTAGRVTFGLAGRESPGVLVAVAEFAGAAPYSARLLLRDSGRTLGPYLVNARAGAALSGRLPPRSTLKGYLAEARSAAGPELLPRDPKAAGWAFRFPAQAAAAFSDLDPREAVAVEFLYPGDKVVTAYVEVGDFAAGRAFLQIASR